MSRPDFVNCINELRLPIVRTVSLLVFGLVTTDYIFEKILGYQVLK